MYCRFARGALLDKLQCLQLKLQVLGYDVRAIASGPHDGTPIRIFGIVSDYHDDVPWDSDL